MVAMGLPESLQRRLFHKLKFTDFDFGYKVQIIVDEDVLSTDAEGPDAKASLALKKPEPVPGEYRFTKSELRWFIIKVMIIYCCVQCCCVFCGFGTLVVRKINQQKRDQEEFQRMMKIVSEAAEKEEAKMMEGDMMMDEEAP